MEADNIRWNMWTLNAKGQRVKWLGQITDPATGFEWIKKQGKQPGAFAINNVPPEGGLTQNPTRVKQALPPKGAKIVDTGEVMMPRSIPAKQGVKHPTRIADIDPYTEPKAFDWAEHDRKQAALRPQRRAERAERQRGAGGGRRKPSAPKKKAAPVVVDPALAQQARARHDVLRDDEAKDMAKESA